MPITLHVPEEFFTSEEEDQIFRHITHTVLALNEASDNEFAVRHLIGDIQRMPKGKSFAAGEPTPYVNITLRVPVFSLDSMGKRQTFVTELTNLVVKLAKGRLERDRVYINMIHGDGFWGVGGIAFSNEVLRDTAMSALKRNM